MKPGFKTAGFYGAFALSVIAVLTGAGAVSDGVLAQVVGMGGTIAAALGYTAWRLKVKQGAEGKAWYKRTETWFSLATVAVTALMASGAFGPDHPVSRAAAGLASILTALGYSALPAAAKDSASK